MTNYIGVIAVKALCFLHIAIDDGCILAMGHYGQFGKGEDFLCGLSVNQHVASRRTHEELYSGYAVLVEFVEKREVVVGCTKKAQPNAVSQSL